MLYFVGVGPGDPELITMKAVRILHEADAIALPDSGSGRSVVERIAGNAIAGKPVLRLPMPMHGRKADWRAAHQEAAKRLLEALGRYPIVAYPVLGDPSVFASSSYLHRLIAEAHPCEMVPGIPAMCAAAARLGVPLCEQGESLTVTGELDDENQLPSGNVVLMKCGKKLETLRRMGEGRSVYVVQNLGMDEERAGLLADFPLSSESYFTTAILKE